MKEILLTRHAKSYANARDVAFGNQQSPLNEQGIVQAWDLNYTFRDKFGITPDTYTKPVAASDYLRPQQTAHTSGFNIIEVTPLINEVEISPDMLGKDKIIRKHRDEGWVPEELQERAAEFIQAARANELDYEIYFTHGFFIAAVLDRLSVEHEIQGQPSPYEFDEKRGFIPRLATITPVVV